MEQHHGGSWSEVLGDVVAQVLLPALLRRPRAGDEQVLGRREEGVRLELLVRVGAAAGSLEVLGDGGRPQAVMARALEPGQLVEPGDAVVVGGGGLGGAEGDVVGARRLECQPLAALLDCFGPRSQSQIGVVAGSSFTYPF